MDCLLCCNSGRLIGLNSSRNFSKAAKEKTTLTLGYFDSLAEKIQSSSLISLKTEDCPLYTWLHIDLPFQPIFYKLLNITFLLKMPVFVLLFAASHIIKFSWNRCIIGIRMNTKAYRMSGPEILCFSMLSDVKHDKQSDVLMSYF